jgi:hypothetical protein
MKKSLKVTALVGGLLTASVANAALITVTHNATVADETAFVSTLVTFQTKHLTALMQLAVFHLAQAMHYSQHQVSQHL